MKKYFLVLFLVILQPGCALAGFGVDVKGVDNSKNESNMGVNTKVNAKGADLIKGADMIEGKGEIRAVSKDEVTKQTSGRDSVRSEVTTNSSEMVMYIFGSVMGLMSLIFGLILRGMWDNLKRKDVMVQDLADDKDRTMKDTMQIVLWLVAIIAASDVDIEKFKEINKK